MSVGGFLGLHGALEYLCELFYNMFVYIFICYMYVFFARRHVTVCGTWWIPASHTVHVYRKCSSDRCVLVCVCLCARACVCVL